MLFCGNWKDNVASKKLMVFLHGWCSSPADFSAQVNYFKKDFSILAINYSDLIIHCTEKNKDYFSLCLSEIKSCIQKYPHDEIILIGHSMGGVMALLLASTLSDARCIILDSTLLQFSEAEKSAFFAGLNAKNGLEALQQFIQTVVDPQYDDPAIIEKIKNQITNTWLQSSQAFNALLKEAMLIEKESHVKKMGDRILYIGATPARTDVNVLRKWNPVMPIEQVRSGHFVTLTAPDECNRIIAHFLLKQQMI
jgi:pimeloyl-ACP methyl ester carboxylesterase